MSTHTPGPYEARKGDSSFAAIYQQGTNHDIAIGVRPDDAAFIVRACNSHEAMLEALKRFAQVIKADNYDQDLLVDIYHDVREAIRLAEGRP